MTAGRPPGPALVWVLAGDRRLKFGAGSGKPLGLARFALPGCQLPLVASLRSCQRYGPRANSRTGDGRRKMETAPMRARPRFSIDAMEVESGAPDLAMPSSCSSLVSIGGGASLVPFACLKYQSTQPSTNAKQEHADANSSSHKCTS